MLKFISNEPNKDESQCEAIEICDDKIQKKKNIISKKLTNHNLQKKKQNVSV